MDYDLRASEHRLLLTLLALEDNFVNKTKNLKTRALSNVLA